MYIRMCACIGLNEFTYGPWRPMQISLYVYVRLYSYVKFR